MKSFKNDKTNRIVNQTHWQCSGGARGDVRWEKSEKEEQPRVTSGWSGLQRRTQRRYSSFAC